MEDLLIHASLLGMQAAWLNAEGELLQFAEEDVEAHTVTGGIYLGKVQRVLPGLQCAFVDFGFERAGFLHIADVPWAKDQAGRTASVEKVLKPGGRCLVRILKSPQGTKGARLSADVSIPGRWMVFCPYADKPAVSKRVLDPKKRAALKALVSLFPKTSSGSFILRTSAADEDVPLEALQSEASRLQSLWSHVLKKKESARAPGALLEDLALPERLLREVRVDSIRNILVDDDDLLARLQSEAERLSNRSVGSILKAVSDDLWAQLEIPRKLDMALGRRIDLPSGAYLVVDEREAMTTIDVNTGPVVGQESPEDTVFSVNAEAATACARLLRLRNFGGIVVIDFIDMEREEHRKAVRQALLEAVAGDSVPTVVGDFTDLGLLCITRERKAPSLLRQSSEPCPHCTGSGWMRTPRFLLRQALEEAQVRVKRCPTRVGGVRIRVPGALADQLCCEKSRGLLLRMEKALSVPIEILEDIEMPDGLWRIDLTS